MHQFSLTFCGKCLPGRDPLKARSAFAKLFGIYDPAALSNMFSGEVFILRTQLDRTEAASLYNQLRTMGVDATLVQVDEQDRAKSAAGIFDPKPARPGMDREIRSTGPGHIDQSWAVPSARRANKRYATPQARGSEAGKVSSAPPQQEQESPPLKRQAATTMAAITDRARRIDLSGWLAKRSNSLQRLGQKFLVNVEEKLRRHKSEQIEILLPAADADTLDDTSELPLQPATVQKQRHTSRMQRLSAKVQAQSREQRTRELGAHLSQRTAPEIGRPRRPGEPNLFALLPYRVAADFSTRGARAKAEMRKGWITALIGLGFVLLIPLLLGRPQPATPPGPVNVLSTAGNELLLIASDRIMWLDRGGTTKAELLREQLKLPDNALARDVEPDGSLLWSVQQAPGKSRLWRCQLATAECSALALTLNFTVSAMAVHPLNGNLLIADAPKQRLLMLTSTGELISQTAMNLPAQPVLHLHAGLLHINDSQNMAINVYRYEAQAFGQLIGKEQLRFKPGANTAAHQVIDFVPAGDSWWLITRSPQDNSPTLHHFDSQWQWLNDIALSHSDREAKLTAWGDRLLVHKPATVEMMRLGSDGKLQAPVRNPALQTLANNRQRQRVWKNVALTSTQVIGVLLLQLGLIYGCFQHLKSQVYRSAKGRGSPSLDSDWEQTQWLAPSPNRPAQLKRWLFVCASATAAALALAIYQGAAWSSMLALSFGCAGVIIALWFLLHSDYGHVGLLNGRLVLADHNQDYHCGKGPQIHYRRNFLIIEDIVVYSGRRWLPSFAASDLANEIAQLVSTGIKIDRATLLVKLIQNRHPIAVAIGIATAGLLSAQLILLML